MEGDIILLSLSNERVADRVVNLGVVNKMQDRCLEPRTRTFAFIEENDTLK